MKFQIKQTHIKNWDKLYAVIGDRFFDQDNPEFKKVIKKFVQEVSRKIKDVIKQSITEGSYYPNADLTLDLKQGSKPLQDTGGLAKSVRYVMVNDRQSFIGILRKDGRTTSKESSNFKKALINHEGARIRVTPKMRAMFGLLASKTRGEAVTLKGRARILWNKSKSKIFYALKKSTTYIFIPPRPFIKKANFDSLEQSVITIFAGHLGRALRKMRKATRKNIK